MPKYLSLATIFKADTSSGILLISCVVLSLLVANSPGGNAYELLLASKLGAGDLKLSLLDWINDGLMAVFFFFIGLEIKQEMLDGHLSSFKKAAVPVVAAMGGAVVPAIIFMLFNNGTSSARGWGIPMATDIAFALGILSLLGKTVPPALKAFLSTLAVVDDVLAIIVIAIFYSGSLSWAYLLLGLSLFVLIAAFNKIGIKHLAFYLIPGVLMWYFIHHSGIHATIAGVLTALAIPHQSNNGSPLQKLVYTLAQPVNFLIMPLFALANTNIRFNKEMLSGVGGTLGIGIIAGLVVGKPIGVMLASWLSVKLNIGKLAKGVTWKQIAGLSILAGIGFTMSIFMSFLSFGNSAHNAEAKLSILIASIVAGCVGYFCLKTMLKRPA